MKISFIGKAKLTKAGQLTLPQEGRQDLSIPIDSELYWYTVDGLLVVSKELLNQKDLEKVLRKKK